MKFASVLYNFFKLLDGLQINIQIMIWGVCLHELSQLRLCHDRFLVVDHACAEPQTVGPTQLDDLEVSLDLTHISLGSVFAIWRLVLGGQIGRLVARETQLLPIEEREGFAARLLKLRCDDLFDFYSSVHEIELGRIDVGAIDHIVDRHQIHLGHVAFLLHTN